VLEFGFLIGLVIVGVVYLYHLHAKPVVRRLEAIRPLQGPLQFVAGLTGGQCLAIAVAMFVVFLIVRSFLNSLVRPPRKISYKTQ
jgi:hypothetical protein